MTDAAEMLDDLESEAPSSVKQGFQRWLMVAGMILTLLFGYFFFAMTKAEDEKELTLATTEEKVPANIQSADYAPNASVERFQRDIMQAKAPVKPTEKIETEIINPAYAPRKKEIPVIAERGRSSPNDLPQESDKMTAYQQYLESEQMRAYKSLSSESTIGDGSAFYDSNLPPSGATMNVRPSRDKEPIRTPQNIASQKTEVQQKIQALTSYREALARGEIDASSPPPDLQNLMRGLPR